MQSSHALIIGIITYNFILIMQNGFLIAVKSGAGFSVLVPDLTANFELDNHNTENFKENETDSTND